MQKKLKLLLTIGDTMPKILGGPNLRPRRNRLRHFDTRQWVCKKSQTISCNSYVMLMVMILQVLAKLWPAGTLFQKKPLLLRTFSY